MSRKESDAVGYRSRRPRQLDPARRPVTRVQTAADKAELARVRANDAAAAEERISLLSSFKSGDIVMTGCGKQGRIKEIFAHGAADVQVLRTKKLINCSLATLTKVKA